MIFNTEHWRCPVCKSVRTSRRHTKLCAIKARMLGVDSVSSSIPAHHLPEFVTDSRSTGRRRR